MTTDADVCGECGAARPRRAAGCPRCGHIFQDVPAAEAGLPAERAAVPRVAGAAPHAPDAHVPDAHVPDAHVPDAHVPDAHVPDAHVPDAHVPDAHAERGSGCGACLLLLAICTLLTLVAGVVLWFIARAELAGLFDG